MENLEKRNLSSFEKNPNPWECSSKDQDGNLYYLSANQEIYNCKLKDGKGIGCGFSADQAYQNALVNSGFWITGSSQKMTEEKILAGTELLDQIRDTKRNLEVLEEVRFGKKHYAASEKKDGRSEPADYINFGFHFSDIEKTLGIEAADRNLIVRIHDLLNSHFNSQLEELKDQFEKL